MHGVGDLTPAISNEVAVDSGKGVDKLGSVLVAECECLAPTTMRADAFSGRERLSSVMDAGGWLDPVPAA